MNPPYEALIRQMFLIHLLEQARKPVQADDLMSSLDNHRLSYGYSYPEERKSRMRLLQRDINAIGSAFGIDIERKGKSSYEIISEDKDRLLNYSRMFADFDLLSALHPDSDINRYVKPERHRNKGSVYLPEILLAIKDRNMIEFDYINYRAGSRERHHIVAPHFLKEDQGLWYVIGYENDKLIIFGLDRIRNLERTDGKFRFDEAIDISERFKDSFGIWADPSIPTEDIELRYDALDGSFLKARPLHPSQEIIADTPEEFRIKLRLKITNDFVMALLSRARSLEVIRPLHLRERIRATLADALSRNS